jgi:hypothetical protein
VDKNTT